jgi:hypothetical protein
VLPCLILSVLQCLWDMVFFDVFGLGRTDGHGVLAKLAAVGAFEVQQASAAEGQQSLSIRVGRVGYM